MKNQFLTKETWTFLIISVICVSVLFAFVDLTPHVDYDVFFSSEDPNYKADIEISRLFPRNDSQIIISVSGDIHSEAYKKRMTHFGDLIMDLDDVTDIKSTMHGPKSVDDAVKSPFWHRLLISNHQRSSNMIVTLDPSTSLDQLPRVIPKVENLKNIFDSNGFRIKISGFPYIVELIRRHLNTDLMIFSSLALLIFGLLVVIIFHSWRILMGMVIACFNAAALTLMITHFLNIKIGILTANLITIVFVLTLSHIVFLTFNWKHLYHIDHRDRATEQAIKITLPASFWAMITTLLGFLSLLYVQAIPIRELRCAASAWRDTASFSTSRSRRCAAASPGRCGR